MALLLDRLPALGSRRLAGLALGTALAVQLLAPPSVLAPAASAAPQKRKKETAPVVAFEPFVGELADARKQAAEQNVPLLLHVILEGEPQNDEYRDHVLPSADLIAASRHAVVVIANDGEHAPKTVKEVVEDREVSREVCSKFPWFARCSDHRAPWGAAYRELADADGAMRCPQTVVELPGGERAWHHDTGNPPTSAEIVAALTKAQQKAGPGLAADELREVKRLVKEGRRALDGKLWGDAWRTWAAVRAIIAVGKYGEEAQAALKEAETAMDAELAAVVARLVPGTAGEAYGELAALADVWRGCDHEGKARAAMKRAEKDKDVQGEVDAKKLELEAEALWAEAEALLRAGDEKAATKVLRKLVKKKYGATPAGRRARERFPELE